MASATKSKKMREEATCSICLQLMAEPMSISCGHSYCQACLLGFMGPASFPRSHRVKETFSCPQCRAPFKRGSLRPSKQLGSLIAALQELELEQEQEEEQEQEQEQELSCQEHGERLQLFCEVEGQLICWRCERTPPHKGHTTELVEQAGPAYRMPWVLQLGAGPSCSLPAAAAAIAAAKPLAGVSPALTVSVAPSNRLQQWKAFSMLKARQEWRLAEVNRKFLCDQKYRHEEDLPEKLAAFKEKYMEFDLNDEGEIDLMSLMRMMEKLGVPKTHLEIRKMVSEVTGGVAATISYRDFVNMMLGKRSSVLKLVMMFEGKAKESSPPPGGPPAERDIASLP